MAEQESALDFIEATHLWSQHAQFVGRAEGAPNRPHIYASKRSRAACGM